jgi:hypothetical protein
MRESLKDKLWHTGGPFGDTLPEPRNEGRVFATHPYPFFLNFSYEKISYPGPSFGMGNFIFGGHMVFSLVRLGKLS